MKGFGRFLSEAFFPLSYTCDICGIESYGNNLCPACLKTITFNDGETCPVCGRKNINSEICLDCKAHAPAFKRAVSAVIYEGGAVPLIYKFKNGNGYLKEFFADLIVKKLDKLPDFDCIVYVPMTEKAILKRGYNQAELIAKSIATRIDKPILKNAVIKIKDTAEQKSLSKEGRTKNIKGCFKVSDREIVKDKKILLVDDVLTTGATTEAICEKLLASGAKQIFVATVFSVEYKYTK